MVEHLGYTVFAIAALGYVKSLLHNFDTGMKPKPLLALVQLLCCP